VTTGTYIMKEKQRNIGIITFAISDTGVIPLSNLIDVLYPLSNELHLVTGGAGYTFFRQNRKIHTYEVEHRPEGNAFIRTWNYAYTQLKVAYKLVQLLKNVDLWIFFIGGEGLILPLLTAKLLRKGVVLVSAGSGLKIAQAKGDPLARVLTLLQSIAYRLSHRIIMYSEKLIEEHGLQKYRRKILIAPRHFLDLNTFKLKRQLKERNGRVGYIGALSKVKGILNFLEAIPRVLEEKNEIEFLIGGSGQLQKEIEVYLENRGLKHKVKLIGWIPHDELPSYLNDLKLLILPSYTEGLPNIVLEAMACGTPVLATAVGAIPDVIKDGETGFIMEDNSPECIAKNIVRALNHHNLGRITKNAHVLVETEFTYEKAVERYRKILGELPIRN